MSEPKTDTVGKALGLLALFGGFPQGATAGRVAAESDMPFSTTYRQLNSLVNAGFLEYRAKDKSYVLGLRVFQLAQQVSSVRGFSGTAMPVLKKLTADTGETSLLAVLDGTRYLTVHKVDGPQFRITTDPGDHGPLHSTAVGRALLAFGDPVATAELIPKLDLTPLTRNTITDPGVLMAELEVIRRRGWATQSEENDVGMVALAVPVLSAAGEATAVLCLAAPIFRRDVAGLELHVSELLAAARELSAMLPSR